MAAESNPWTWSPEHGDYYIAKKTIDGIWEYGFSKSAPSSNGKTQSNTMSEPRSEIIDPSFQRAKDPAKYFIPGKVFATMTVVDEVEEKRRAPSISLARYGEEKSRYVKINRFVVVKPKYGEKYSKCLRISTYGGHATTKKNVDQEAHTIIYTSAQAPAKLPGEDRLYLNPIRVAPSSPTTKLDPLSRVNLAETSSVKYDTNIRDIGSVHATHLKMLLLYWKCIAQDCNETDSEDLEDLAIKPPYRNLAGVEEDVEIRLKPCITLLQSNSMPHLGSEVEIRNRALADISGFINDPNEPVQISDVESIFSADSRLSSLSSRSTLYSYKDFWAASEFAALLVNDKPLARIFNAVLDDDRISAERFERNFRRMLKQFAIELGNEAHKSLERAAARFAGSHAREIAHRIAQLKEDVLRVLPNRHRDDRRRPRSCKANADEESHSSEGSGLEDHDSSDLPSLQDVHAFIVSSKALSFLRHRILQFVQPSVLQAIAEEVKLGTRSDTLQEAVFQIRWELKDYVMKELERDTDFASLLTISGTAKNAYATTCGEYMERNWPKSGLETLKILQVAISQDIYETQRLSGFTFSYTQKNEECAMIKVSGSQDHIIEVAQQLSWLGASFRIPQHDSLTLSDTVLQLGDDSKFQLFLLDLQQVTDSEVSCWYPLFENGIIARGFPIPPREGERGIELPFGVMATLAHITYPMEMYDGIILKGASTALIPTRKYSSVSNTSIQWHLITTNAPDLQLTMDFVADQVSKWYETTNFSLLSSARTFLGYCKNTAIHLGTRESNFGNLKRSDAMSERDRPEISKEVSASLGSSGMGFFGAMLGLKVVYPKTLRGVTKSINLSLEERLLRSKDHPLLLYDTETKRGWLVPELSAILHIAHIWDTRHTVPMTKMRNTMPYADALGDGGLAAWNAIWRGRTLELSNHGIEGKPELFIDVIKTIVAALESRKELVIERENNSGSQLWKRSGLRGWELVDIITSKFMFNRKEVSINTKTGGDWYHIASENPDVIVLFCNGLGEPIKPAEEEEVCRTWTPVPKGNDYLTASVNCLEKLAGAHGDLLSSLKLTPNLYWHRPSGERLFEGCSYDGESHCNPLQDLRRKNYMAPGTLEANGAVIFGRIKPTKISHCEPLKKPVQEGEDEYAIQAHALSRLPKQEFLARQPICDDNIAFSPSNCLCNGPIAFIEHATNIIKPHANGNIHSKYSSQEPAKHASTSQIPQHSSKAFNTQTIDCGSHGSPSSTPRSVRRRPQFGDLRNENYPVHLPEDVIQIQPFKPPHPTPTESSAWG